MEKHEFQTARRISIFSRRFLKSLLYLFTATSARLLYRKLGHECCSNKVNERTVSEQAKDRGGGGSLVRSLTASKMYKFFVLNNFLSSTNYHGHKGAVSE